MSGEPDGSDLTPKRIVEALDRHIVGQEEAKRAVAIAIRNRWRRLRLPPEVRKEITPKNILMIGPTGVGKTEIARRLAALVKAPFLKVEASRYTEVGYVGRDVESMIRDLVEISVEKVRAEQMRAFEDVAKARVEDALVELLVPSPRRLPGDPEPHGAPLTGARRKVREQLRSGAIETQEVEVTTDEKSVPMIEVISNQGIEQMGVDFQNFMERMVPSKTVSRRVPVSEARRILEQKEMESKIDRAKVVEEAVRRAEESGIVFIDEIDKVAGPGSSHGPDVSRQGVQRDLLPIIEGTTVLTRYGMVKTDYILFIAAGAFHMTKPSDLIPELQGRFPIRVELKNLSRDDFVRILREPEASITRQYQMLLSAEGVRLAFEDSAIDAMADIAFQVNSRTLNIGARRLHTVLERVLEEVSFEAPDRAGQEFRIDAKYVKEKLKPILKDEDLSKFVL